MLGSKVKNLLRECNRLLPSRGREVTCLTKAEEKRRGKTPVSWKRGNRRNLYSIAIRREVKGKEKELKDGEKEGGHGAKLHLWGKKKKDKKL